MTSSSARGRQTGLMFVLVTIDAKSLFSFFKVGLFSCGIEIRKCKLLTSLISVSSIVWTFWFSQNTAYNQQRMALSASQYNIIAIGKTDY